MNLNKVFIIGRLTADPEVKSTPTGQKVANFSMATNRYWTDQASGQKKEATEFHNIVLWGRQADVAGQFLAKGSIALIEGRLQTRKYEDKQGVTKYITEIVGEQLQLGPRPSGNGYAQSSNANTASNDMGSPAKDDDIPIINLGDEGIVPDDLPF